MRIAKVAGVGLALVAGASCNRPVQEQPNPPASASTAPSSPRHDAPASTASALTDVSDAASVALDAAAASTPNSPCPADMVLVEGDFCPGALQRCAKHHAEWEKRKEDPTVSERCLEYAKPSKCLTPRRKLRFCIDLYEWPNKRGELPIVLVQWLEAKKQCETIGKRLCDEEEWLFACEGEEMLPHVYGYVRDPTKCQIDRPYVKREYAFKRYTQCLADPECKAAFDKLDQRKPAGSFPECISPFGVFDLNGSVNEWVNIIGAEKPNRSGLKGGWWGPVRSRCRPTVKFHKEEDWGYEAGFRCCKGAHDRETRLPAPEADAAARDSAIVIQTPAAPVKARKREPPVLSEDSSAPPAASAPIEEPQSPASAADGSL